MRKLILKMSMSLDAFVAGPNGESDWIFRTTDDESNAWSAETISRAGIHAMGSRTFAEMAAHWPWGEAPFAEPMNAIPKVVFSRRSLAELTRDVGEPAPDRKEAPANEKPTPEATAKALLSWRTPRVLSGSLSEELYRLKEEPGKDIIVYGGARLARSIVKSGLVDEYLLLVHPVALGRGLPIFSDLTAATDLELVYAKSFKKGTVAHLYRPKKR